MIYPSLALCLCHYGLFQGCLLTRACPTWELKRTGGCGQPPIALGSPLLLVAGWFLPTNISSDGHHTEWKEGQSPFLDGVIWNLPLCRPRSLPHGKSCPVSWDQ